MSSISLAELKLAVIAFPLLLTKGIYILKPNTVSVMEENVKQLDKGMRTHTFLTPALSQAALHLHKAVTCQCSNSNTV